MDRWLAVFLGAGFGGVLRFSVGGLFAGGGAGQPGAFPVGTLVVNVTGCLAIGVLASMLTSEPWKLFLMVGVLGGYTTFSAFGRETIELISRGEVGRAAVYVVLSNALGLAAVWAGMIGAARFVASKP